MKTVQSVKNRPVAIRRLELLMPDKGTNSGTLVEFADKSGKAIKSLLLGKKYVRESQGSSPSAAGTIRSAAIMVVESQPKVWVISDACQHRGLSRSVVEQRLLQVERFAPFRSPTNATNSGNSAGNRVRRIQAG